MSIPIPLGKTVVEITSKPSQSSFEKGDLCYIEGISHGAGCGAYMMCVRIADGYVDFADSYNVRAVTEVDRHALEVKAASE